MGDTAGRLNSMLCPQNHAVTFLRQNLGGLSEQTRKKEEPMYGAAAGIVVVYVFLFVIAFLIAVVIMRAVFRINKIVDLLSSIDESLRSNSRPTAPAESSSARPASSGRESSAALPFKIRIGELSVGDRLETPGGSFVEIVDFARNGLKVKDSSGITEILRPVNREESNVNWIFEARRA